MAELFHTLNIDPKVIASQITGFILLWVVLARFLFRPVMALLDARDQEIKSIYENAQNEHARAEELRVEYEQRISAIESEARSRIQAAIKQGESMKDEIVADARRRSDDILRRGQQDLVRERDKALAELREEIVEIAITAAGKIVAESLDDAKHRKLVSDFINKLEVGK
ncbi:MAG: F0F1 ATP synthase subunit B [Armatimonadota bacterium]